MGDGGTRDPISRGRNIADKAKDNGVILNGRARFEKPTEIMGPGETALRPIPRDVKTKTASRLNWGENRGSVRARDRKPWIEGIRRRARRKRPFWPGQPEHIRMESAEKVLEKSAVRNRGKRKDKKGG